MPTRRSPRSASGCCRWCASLGRRPHDANAGRRDGGFRDVSAAVAAGRNVPPPAGRFARRRKLGRALKGAAGVALLLLLWQLSVPLVGLSSYFYPSPADVVVAFGDLLRKGILPVYFADSMGRYAAGLSIGSLAGIVLVV